MSWTLTVGMEVHVELETKTKMFCGCKNDPFHAEPNTNVCTVCYGLPGALPLLNKEAIAMVIRFGQAIGAQIPTTTFWARKSYFYPDLPKGYQISQSGTPLVNGGVIAIDGTQHRLHHAHLEEDAGKLMHHMEEAGDYIPSTDEHISTRREAYSLVNYNRAGVPLLEIVTEPDFHAPEDVKKFCQELQRIMRSLKVSSADMEKGHMRCEANISVSQTDELGTKVEVKNINSFRAVEKAIQYEFDRQVKALEAGEMIKGETRTWSDTENKTVPMRSKETSADYRYFPEPDLPMVALEVGKTDTHLLPDEQRVQFVELGLSPDLARKLVDKNFFSWLLAYNEQVTKSRGSGNSEDLLITAANLLDKFPDLSKLKPQDADELIWGAKKDQSVGDVTFGSYLAEVLSGESVSTVVNVGFTVEEIPVGEVITENPSAVADYKSGKEAAFQYLVGQVMAKTKGRANIQEVRTELKKALEV